MKIYDCLINRGRDVALCEVPKAGISEHELRVLRDVHGGEAITKVDQVGEREFHEDDEIKRLAAIYGLPRIEKLFGVQIENFEDWVTQRLEGKGSPRDSSAVPTHVVPTHVVPTHQITPAVEDVEDIPIGTLTMGNIKKKPVEARVE